MFWVHHSWTFSYWMKIVYLPIHFLPFMPKTKFPALSSIASLTSLVSPWVSRPSQPQPQAHGRILDEEEEDDDAGQAPPVPRPGYIANRSDESWMVGWLILLVGVWWCCTSWFLIVCWCYLVDRSWWFWGLVGYCDLGWGHFDNDISLMWSTLIPNKVDDDGSWHPDEPMSSSASVNLYDWVHMVILMVLVHSIVQMESTIFNFIPWIELDAESGRLVTRGKPAPRRGTRRHPSPTGSGSHASRSPCAVSWDVGRGSCTHGDRGSEKQESEGAGIQTGWWFQIFLFSPLFGEDYQRGWNHQPAEVFQGSTLAGS